MDNTTALTWLRRLRASLPYSFENGKEKREALHIGIKAVEVIEAWKEDQKKLMQGFAYRPPKK